jgi:hypothetical protein
MRNRACPSSVVSGGKRKGGKGDLLLFPFEVKVVWHQTPANDPHGNTVRRRGRQLGKGPVVGLVVEHPRTTIAAINRAITNPAYAGPCGPRHDKTLPDYP